MSLKQRFVMLILLVLFQLLHVIASLWLLSTILVTSSVSRSRKIALSYDQLGNATMGGDEDETMSSMLGRTGKPVWLVRLTNWIFFELYGQANHCQSKIEPRFKK